MKRRLLSPDGQTGGVEILSKSEQGFWRHRQDFSQIYIEGKGTRAARTNMKKTDKVGGVTATDFKTYCTAVGTGGGTGRDHRTRRENPGKPIDRPK